MVGYLNKLPGSGAKIVARRGDRSLAVTASFTLLGAPLLFGGLPNIQLYKGGVLLGLKTGLVLVGGSYSATFANVDPGTYRVDAFASVIPLPGMGVEASAWITV